ncbi:GTP cyclohydrolase FolE2 [Halopseudomonas maritima]|uniref:GTP cyclohydrolase FolE2 n=1 Tax=Halopseudomonas maritima TaxID=2918528 RepID=UPI001EECAB1B|nr:GTP cyclohydrolase FolE2 [Halopseudomonas maritima]UJJ32781.1 GTP cyclohydrolase FolE2 [Halopseudomonas maritima]
MSSLSLPDVSLTDAAATPGALQWVGMQGIDLPLRPARDQAQVHARADVQVDLSDPAIKGIHMSRLYRLLERLAPPVVLTPVRIRMALQEMVDSQADCHSRGARIGLRFDLLCRRPALLSPDLAGWKSYPVQLDASLQHGEFRLDMQIQIGYASTCPCSAALARRRVAEGFAQAFAATEAPTHAAVSDWLLRHASLATPHSQRSEAQVTVALDEADAELPLLALVDQVEAALGTPLQTAVKRADEQAFAELNGQNLMFVEDAARRIQAALRQGQWREPRAQVCHMESLHPHDAVAWAAGV